MAVPLSLTHVRLLVNDYPACFEFYREVVGLEATFGDEVSGYAEFQTGPAVLAIFDAQQMAAALGRFSRPGRCACDCAAVVLAVDNVDSACQHLKRQGVNFITEPTDRPDWGIRTAHFRDPEGNLVEINAPL